MTEPEATLSPERAAEVWRRAAQLQAQAAQRLEERSHALAIGRASADPHPQDFSLDEVRAAAVEAGIAPEFVALAVAEAGGGTEQPLSPAGESAATAYLGVAHRTVEVARIVERPAAQVYEAMQRVLVAHPWYLALRDITGDPVDGGILVFDIPAYTSSCMTPFAYHATAVDVKQLQVMLRPVPGRAGACELVVSAALTRSVRRNFKVAGWLTGLMGGLGAGGGAGVAAMMGLAGGMVALPVAGAAVAMGGATAVGIRALYRYSLRNFTELLGRLLQGVDAHARTGGAFTPVPRPPSGGDDGTGMTATVITTTIT